MHLNLSQAPFVHIIIGGISLTVDKVFSASFKQLTLGAQSSKSSTRATTRSYPLSVIAWENFNPGDFMLSHVTLTKLSVHHLWDTMLEVRNEIGMEDRFITSIAHTLNQFSADIGTIERRTGGSCCT